jgi:hypothetical protein
MTHQLFSCERSVNSQNSRFTNFGLVSQLFFHNNSFHTFGLPAWELLELLHDLFRTIFSAYLIDELAFEVGTNRCHKGEVFRL